LRKNVAIQDAARHRKTPASHEELDEVMWIGNSVPLPFGAENLRQKAPQNPSPQPSLGLHRLEILPETGPFGGDFSL
jgi:hypothetical protein